MSKPPFLSLINGNGRFKVRRVQFGEMHRYYKPTYRLTDQQTGIDMAGGDMAHMMRTYEKLA